MQTITVYQADSFKVVHGANSGDTMSFADELMLDDVYTLKKVSRRCVLPVVLSDDGLTSEQMGIQVQKVTPYFWTVASP